MKALSRRTFVTRTAAGATAVAASAALAANAGAASTAFTAPKVIRSQDSSTEITFYHIWGTPPGGEEKETKHPSQQVIDAFNAKNTGVTVNGQTPSGDYYEVLQKAQADMAAGNPPALVITPWASINYANEGLGVISLEEIGGDETAGVLANIKETVLPLVQLEDKTVGLPYAFSCPIVYYNNDVLKQAGVDPAVMLKDWASFKDEGAKVQSALNGNPILGISYNKDWPAQSLIQSNGGFILDESGTPVMNSPEAIAAMQAIADLDQAGLYDRGTSKELRPSFVGGATAAYIGSVASLGGMRRDVAFDLQTAPFPVFAGMPRKMSSGGSFIGCYAQKDEQRKAAWEFLKFAISEEGYKIWMQTGYLNASTYEIEHLEGQEAAYTQLDEGLTRETPWPGARGGELQATWGTYVERIWASDISAEDGCNQAADELKSMIG